MQQRRKPPPLSCSTTTPPPPDGCNLHGAPSASPPRPQARRCSDQSGGHCPPFPQRTGTGGASAGRSGSLIRPPEQAALDSFACSKPPAERGRSKSWRTAWERARRGKERVCGWGWGRPVIFGRRVAVGPSLPRQCCCGGGVHSRVCA
jgi:hypothetical protein